MLSRGLHRAGRGERLAAEPTVLAPRRLRRRARAAALVRARRRAASSRRWRWSAGSPSQPRAGGQGARAGRRKSQRSRRWSRCRAATNDYLLAHQGFSPRMSLQGMAPYVRTVAEPARERAASEAGGPLGARARCSPRRRRRRSRRRRLGWLRKIHEATQQPLLQRHLRLPERRTAPRPRASRATRAGDIEKLEVLDGVPREIVRTRDTVRCYLPDSQGGQGRARARRPQLSRRCCPSSISALARHYDISLGETQRIAGFDCQAVVLTPKDNLRYGYRLYADVSERHAACAR